MNLLNELILISIFIILFLILIGLILLLFFWKKKKEGKIVGEPNYQVFFIIGISWIPIGIVFMLTINTVIGIAFMSMGLAYISIGLANKDKWGHNK